MAQVQMELDRLFSKRCVLVAGKGGVGRSSVAAALALAAGRRGRRVLLTEIDDETAGYSPLARLFGRERLPEAVPGRIAPGVLGVALLARTGQEQFLGSIFHSTALVHAAMGSESLRRLVNAGPSFREMGVFHQLLTLLRSRRPDGSPEHETIVIDMPATGHALSMTALPEQLLRLVQRGPIADNLREGQRYLNDPAKAEAWVVTLPEVLPVSECLELLGGLERTSMPVGGVIVNRLPMDPFTPEQREVLAPLAASGRVLGADSFSRIELSEREVRRLSAGCVGCSLRVRGLPELAAGPDLASRLCDALEREDPSAAILGAARRQPRCGGGIVEGGAAA
jgi:anion-transporting  ArsA/GET3 family ATPase